MPLGSGVPPPETMDHSSSSGLLAGDRSSITLGFLDPDLERRYRHDLALNGSTQLRFGTMASAVLWLLAGFLMPIVTPIDPPVAYGMSAGMVVANLAGWAVVHRRREHNQQQALVITLTSLAALAGLWLATVTDLFQEYGGLSLMLITIFAFVVFRLRFVFAIAVGPIYVLMFVALSLAAGSEVFALQTFLVISAIVVATVGTRMLESVSRDRYVQQLQIAALHAQVERLFRRYLSPDVADAMLSDPSISELGGRVDEVSVLFADLQGFTPMSERRTPDEVVKLLNRYFEVAVPAVLSEGGTIISFAGDALMALFNAPIQQLDHSFRAARAALAIQQAIGSVGERSSSGETPRFRVGINTGPALVGNIGSAEIRTFTAIGDTINLASRLQTWADPGTVVIGPATYDQIKDVADVRTLDPIQLKGKSSPVQAYELLALDLKIRLMHNDGHGP